MLCHSVRVCTENDLTDANVYKCKYLAVDNCESLSASALVDLLWQRVHHSMYTQIMVIRCEPVVLYGTS